MLNPGIFIPDSSPSVVYTAIKCWVSPHPIPAPTKHCPELAHCEPAWQALSEEGGLSAGLSLACPSVCPWSH